MVETDWPHGEPDWLVSLGCHQVIDHWLEESWHVENGRSNLRQKWVLLCIGASARCCGTHAIPVTRTETEESRSFHSQSCSVLISAQCVGIFVSWQKKLGTEVGSFMYVSLSRCCGTEESTSFFSRSPSDFCSVRWHLYQLLHSWYWRWSIVVCFSIWSPVKGRSLCSRWWTTPPSPVPWSRSSSLNMWVDGRKLHTNMLVFVVIFIFTMYSVSCQMYCRKQIHYLIVCILHSHALCTGIVLGFYVFRSWKSSNCTLFIFIFMGGTKVISVNFL